MGVPHQLEEFKEPVNAVQLGLLTLAYKFSDVSESNGFVSIIFEECPLNFNLNNPLVPKCEMLICIKPYDNKYYRVKLVCKDMKFWSSISEERIVAVERISETISESIFAYTASHRREMLFEKHIQREELLRSVQASEVSILELAQSHTLDCFSNKN